MKKNIPNIITCCNLVSGCIAIMCAFYGNVDYAFLFIILGAIFDFFDGMTARLLGVSSNIGKELDSLADVVTFGVAPSAIVFWLLCVAEYPEVIEPSRDFVPVLAFVIAAFSALRLAKFNLDTRQTTSFIGLPTPANALFWGALIAGYNNELLDSQFTMPLTIIGIGLCSWLLVSEVPMFALKFKHWGFKGNEIKYIFVALAAILIMVGIISGITSGNSAKCYTGIPLVIVAYIVISIATEKK